MTETEAREKSHNKIKQLKALAKELQIQIDAKQMLVKGNFLENTVIFTDMEQYDIEKVEKVVRNPLMTPHREKPINVENKNVENTPPQQ